MKMILDAAVMLMCAVKTGFMGLQQPQSFTYSIFECKKVFLKIYVSFSDRTRLLSSVPALMTN